MIPYAQNYTMLITTALLMFAGGIGFITWRELSTKWNPWNTTKKKLSLQTSIILSYYVFFVIANTLLFWLLEHNNTFDNLNTPLQIVNSFFTSVSTRSGGYLTVSPHDMQYSSLFSMMINTFIGSAPGSTGSGIKLTTMAIFMATINSAILNKSSVDIAGRRIMKDQVYKALAIVSLSVLWILVTVFCLLITENNWSFLDISFETMSAFGTLGISVGLLLIFLLLVKSLLLQLCLLEELDRLHL